MKWAVVFSDAKPQPQILWSETIEADQMFVTQSGVLQFLNKLEPESAPVETAPTKTKRKPFKARAKLVCIRAFNSQSWTDVVKQ